MLIGFTSSWIRLLCALPFMVSLLLPVGMMPVVSADGTITLVICTGHGPKEKSFPAGDEETDEQPESASSWCPFSLASAPVLASAPLRWTGVTFDETVAFVSALQDTPAHADIPTSRPRGPPSIL